MLRQQILGESDIYSCKEPSLILNSQVRPVETSRNENTEKSFLAKLTELIVAVTAAASSCCFPACLLPRDFHLRLVVHAALICCHLCPPGSKHFHQFTPALV